MYRGKRRGEGFCRNLEGECTNFIYRKRPQLSVLNNEQRGLPEYFKCGKIAWWLRLRWGAYSVPPDSLAGGEGLTVPSPRTQSTLLSLRASNLVAFGHSFHAP